MFAMLQTDHLHRREARSTRCVCGNAKKRTCLDRRPIHGPTEKRTSEPTQQATRPDEVGTAKRLHNPTVVWARVKISRCQAAFTKYITSLHYCHIKMIQGGDEKLASFCPTRKSGHRIHAKAPLMIFKRHSQNDCRIS